MTGRASNVFSLRLKTAREAAGYSQRGLGIALGFHPDSASPRLNQYERGRREPDLDTASRMATALKVPLAYLYCEEEDTAQMLLDLSRLDQKQRKRVLGEVRALAQDLAEVRDAAPATGDRARRT